MSTVFYNKLIRDKIPEIIIADGKKPKVYTLNQKQYISELSKKVIEEAKELQFAKSKEDILNELSDLQELIDAILLAHQTTKDELTAKQKIKREKRGGFSLKLFLESIED